ncbi:MAG: hypothetical protein V4515_02355 [Chloroflexota bacterium]
MRLLERAGRRVTAMYVTHWIIVGWGIGLVGFQDLKFVPTVFAMATVVALTGVVATRVNLGRRVALAGA